MHLSTRAFLFVAAALLTASCSDTNNGNGLTQPSEVNESRLVVEVTEPNVVARRVSDPACPTVSPFNVGFGVTVRASGGITVIVTGIRMQFVDLSGARAAEVTVPMIPVTLPAPGPTPQFGVSNAQLAQSFQRFPLELGIGCGTIGTRGTIVVFVDTTDGRGRRGTERVQVTVG
jgi:hypothetical protein